MSEILVHEEERVCTYIEVAADVAHGLGVHDVARLAVLVVVTCGRPVETVVLIFLLHT